MTEFPLKLEENGPMVRMELVTKRFGNLTVLDRLDLDIARNEIVSIIGPSGSGKTTVLRVLMTLEEIQGGVVYIDGKPLTHMARNGRLVPAKYRHLRQMRVNIGMVFQHFNLFPHMTALEELHRSRPMQCSASAASMPASAPKPSCSRWSASPTRSTRSGDGCPAASSSVWRSPGPWRCGPR